MVDMTIGDRLRTLREAAGLDMVQAAKIAGTTKQSVGQIENGRTKTPGGLFLYRWARHYEVDLEWLITGVSRIGQSHPDRRDLDNLATALEMVRAHTQGEGLTLSSRQIAKMLIDTCEQLAAADHSAGVVKMIKDLRPKK